MNKDNNSLQYELINGHKFPLITWYMVKFKKSDYEVGVVCNETEFKEFLDKNKDDIDFQYHKDINNMPNNSKKQ